MYVNQQIANTVTVPSITWFTDSILPKPLLRFPADTSKLCPPITLKVSQNTGIVLTWDTVIGASFYILQLSLDSQQFSGPGLRSIRTTSTQYNLKYIDDIRMGQTIYWRVYAHNAVGGQSLSSAVRSFSLECPGFQGLGKNPEDPASTIPVFSCDSLGSDIQITGSDVLVKGTSEAVYVVDVSYDCKSFRGLEVSVASVLWSVDVPDPDNGTAAVAEIVSQNEQYVTLKTSSSLIKPHTFDLKVLVTYELLDPNTMGVIFEPCEQKKRILVGGLGGGGTKLRHAIVRELCSSECNTYKVEFVNRSFDESCGGTGTGSGTSTGTGS